MLLIVPESVDQYVAAEAAARRAIDRQLEECGWVVQNITGLNLNNGRGVAVREFPLEDGHGRADYLLSVTCRERWADGTLLSGSEPTEGAACPSGTVEFS